MNSETLLLAWTLVLPTRTEMSHPTGGFLHINLGCPDPHSLLSCKPGFLLKLSLEVWTQLGGRCQSSFPTCTSQSTREMGDLALALSTATASENYRRCFQLCCLHSSSKKWAGFLSHSWCRHFFWTTPHAGPPCVTVFSCSYVTIDFSGSEVAVSLYGVALPHWDPQAGQLCSYDECLQELSCPLHGGLKRPTPRGCGEHSTLSRV